MSPKNTNNCDVHTSDTLKEETDKEFVLLEYQSLRSELLQRYDYANKLFTQLITFSTSVWAGALTLFTLIVRFFDTDFTKLENANYIVPIEMLQIALVLLPAVFSVIIFHYSLRNSIRICLISDYLRLSIHNRKQSVKKSWEHMKNKKKITYHDFNRIKSTKSTSMRPRERNVLHIGISLISIIVALILIFTVCDRCLPHDNSGEQIIKVNWYILGMICSSIGVFLLGLFPYIPCSKNQNKKKENTEETTVSDNNSNKDSKRYSTHAYVISFGIKVMVSVIAIYFIQKYTIITNDTGTIKQISVYLFWFLSLVILIVISIVPLFPLESKRANQLIQDNADKIEKYFLSDDEEEKKSVEQTENITTLHNCESPD